MQTFAQGNEYLDIPCAHSLQSTSWNCEVVIMSGKALCFCFQHPLTPQNDTNLAFTIVSVHHALSLTYTVPTLPLTPEQLSCVRIHFGTIGMPNVSDHSAIFMSYCAGDQVLAYIPGVFMQLIDCGSSHEPSHHLTFIGDDAPRLPNQTDADDRSLHHLSHFDILRRHVIGQPHGMLVERPVFSYH